MNDWVKMVENDGGENQDSTVKNAGRRDLEFASSSGDCPVCGMPYSIKVRVRRTFIYEKDKIKLEHERGDVKYIHFNVKRCMRCSTKKVMPDWDKYCDSCRKVKK